MMPIWRQKNVRRKMDTQRITIRLPQHDIHSIDLFIRAGEFATRSEVIRHAVNDFIKNYANNIIEKADKIKKVQELELAVESIEPYMKK
jgi:Arc/MetJ-type ribon-helix-helix transcriptional regulator